MREASVVGFMPSNSAAPPGPKILPPVCFSAAAMRVAFLALQFVARQQGGFEAAWVRARGASVAFDPARSKRRGPPRERMTARSTVF